MTKLIGYNIKEGEEREENDFYATCPSAISPLLKFLDWQHGGKIIRENSCGQGHLSKELIKHRHTVISTDLIDRGYGISGVDFLKHTWFDNLYYDAIIMNPPYKYAMEFVQKSLTLAPTVCAFLRLNWLQAINRHDFFQNTPPKYVCIFSYRIASAKNGDFEKYGKGQPMVYAWFIWEKGFKGDPFIKWFTR